jgi:hypothetical protein
MVSTAQLARKIRFRGSLNQLRMGIKVESEHKRTVGNHPLIFAKIARDHLYEMPNYYTRLHRMEARK